ncbi:hypothetical protein FQZ97_911420 [compost metagenome]
MPQDGAAECEEALCRCAAMGYHSVDVQWSPRSKQAAQGRLCMVKVKVGNACHGAYPRVNQA